jgi:hypothetical protein
MNRFILAALIGGAFNSSVSAGGLLGDTVSAIGNVVAPNSNIGKPLDDLNRQLKHDAPVYGTVEEGASAAVRNTSREFLVESAGPVLAGMIQASREDTLRGGVQDVPSDVRDIMARFYGFDVAAGIRFRVGQGGDLALASNAFRYGDALAITLDDVIVFRDQLTAQDLSIWAHELQHVQQFRSWGILDFSKRYVRDYGGVEREAYSAQDRYIQWAQANLAAYSGGPSGTQFAMPTMPQMSSVCGTPMGACVVPGVGMIGQGCWCGTSTGPVNGQLVQN